MYADMECVIFEMLFRKNRVKVTFGWITNGDLSLEKYIPL